MSVDIDWRGPTPVSTRFGDVYYSADDPIGEIRHTFLDGVDFNALCGQPRLCIAETGFGTGLNFLESWHRWDSLASRDASFDFVSVEAFPMDVENLARAHAPFPHLTARATALRDRWPGAVPGAHRIALANGRVRLILLIGEAASMLTRHGIQADAWFLDGFSPARNPEMWRQDVLNAVAAASRPRARAATFTAAGSVRRGLIEAGFAVDKRPGFGRKRDCLRAVLTGTPPPLQEKPWTAPPPPLSPNAKIAVIGGGIAGCAAVRALRRIGKETVHIAGSESRNWAASTLPLALIAPKLVRGDQPYPRFWRQAYHDALRELNGMDDVWTEPRGVILPAVDDAASQRQSALTAALQWPQSIIHPIHASAATDAFGAPLPDGLYLPQAGTVDVPRLLEQVCGPADIEADIAEVAPQGSRWRLCGPMGRTVVEADAVILATGAGTATLMPGPSGGFGLRIGTGRLLMACGADGPGRAALMNGYVTAAGPDGRYAAGATADPWAMPGPIPDDPDRMMDLRRRLAPLWPNVPAHAQAWSGLRCDTIDHLPLAGPVQNWDFFAEAYAGLRHGKPTAGMPAATWLPGLYALTGLGARGFQAAFLLADHVAAQINGTTIPVDTALHDALAPGRFQIRSIRQGGNGVADGT